MLLFKFRTLCMEPCPFNIAYAEKPAVEFQYRLFATRDVVRVCTEKFDSERPMLLVLVTNPTFMTN